jgi:hypothetical protein
MDIYGHSAIILQDQPIKASTIRRHVGSANLPRSGAGLILMSREHLADDIVTNRIREIAAGAIAIAPEMPPPEHFGDSIPVLTARPDRSFTRQSRTTRRDQVASRRDRREAEARSTEERLPEKPSLIRISRGMYARRRQRASV